MTMSRTSFVRGLPTSLRPVAVLVFALAAAFGTARDAVTFNFGWKHRSGLHEWAQPDSEPPVDPDPGLHPAEAQVDYDASDWIDVRLPHDGLIAAAPSSKACPDGCSGKSFLPRHVLWYRKAFSLPTEWAGSAVWLDFEGSFRNTTVWVNSDRVANHVCGYTPFRVRLDSIESVAFGPSSKNEIAVFVDPDNGDGGGRERGSGWWYEGGGLYRNVHLIRTNQVHVDSDGLFVSSDIALRNDGAPTGKSAVVHARVSMSGTSTDGKGNRGFVAQQGVCVSFKIVAPNGSIEAETKPQEAAFDAHGSAVVRDAMSVLSPELWSLSNPALYQVTATVEACDTGKALDSVSVPHGFRTLKHTADSGFFLNGLHFKVRGFCDHNTFAVVGMAVPDRVNLFRAQASRAVGGNGRRTSHNPPSPSMLDIYDRLGMVVMDENRLFDNNTAYVGNFATLVKRDRNHPSVVIWSFCNEVGCEGEHEAGGPAFQAVATEHDGTRPTLANMFTFNDLLSNTVDVQGFSHQSRAKLDQCHADMPSKPIYMSECCSCNTMRDEDVGCETDHDNPHTICTQIAFNARCLESNGAVNASDGAHYAVGTMVWTLFDYYGEPPVGGPEVSGTYGQFDLCGFPKAAAFWFRTQWLLGVPDGSSDKTFPTHGSYEVHIVESWESPDSWNETKGNVTRAIHAYSNAPYVELFVNSKSQGSRSVVPMRLAPGSYAEWTDVPWEAGTLTAIARDNDGQDGGERRSLARADRRTNGRPARLVLSLDAPSVATGSGTTLLLDGQDAALVRCTVVDEKGETVRLSKHNITFRVVLGPGYIQGTHNGDPHCHQPNNAPFHTAYHGLVRAVVRVSSVVGIPVQERGLLGKIDRHGPMAAIVGGDAIKMEDAATEGENGGRSSHGLRGAGLLDDGNIVVEAASPGFEPARIEILTSADPNVASVLKVAQASAGKEVDFFHRSILGKDQILATK